MWGRGLRFLQGHTRRLHFPDSLAAGQGHMITFWPMGYGHRGVTLSHLAMKTAHIILPTTFPGH